MNIKEIVIKYYLMKFKKGNLEAFDKLYSRYFQSFRQIALHFLKNKNDTADCIQNVFIKIFRYIKSYDAASSAFSWIYTIIKNEAFTLNAQYRMLVGLPEDYDIADSRDDINEFIEMEDVKALFDNHEKIDFDVFYMKQFEFYSFAEIAEKTGLSKSGAYKRYNKVLDEILKIYKESGKRLPKIQSILNIKYLGDSTYEKQNF